jgi:hypothetical protein
MLEIVAVCRHNPEHLIIDLTGVVSGLLQTADFTSSGQPTAFFQMK